MLNVTTVLTRFNIDVASPLKAVQDVRVVVEEASDPLTQAIKIINDVTGLESVYQDLKFALHVAQGVVERAVKLGDKFLPIDAIREAEESAAKLRANAAMAWLFNSGTEGSAPDKGATKSIAGKKVSVKADGSIKKGGKQEAALALYITHVVGGLVTTNQEFISVLMKELNMGKAGATTYAYNARAQHKASGGADVALVRSTKGRKSKV